MNELIPSILQQIILAPAAKDEMQLLDLYLPHLHQLLATKSIALHQQHPSIDWLLVGTENGYLTDPEPTPISVAKQLNSSIKKATQTETELFYPLVLADNQIAILSLTVEQTPIPPSYLIYLEMSASHLQLLWNNLLLIAEAKNNQRELNILQGRYLDSLWRQQSEQIEATLTDQKLSISRSEKSTSFDDSAVPILLDELEIGQISIPGQSPQTLAEDSFFQSLIREMGLALKNAQLIQTTKAYSTQLQIASDLAQSASTILDQKALIENVVQLIQERLDLYYVGLFLLDNEGYAVLQAGTGTAGATQVAQQHKLLVGGGSMIGQASKSGLPKVAHNVTQVKDFKPNPLLPETRSELALPLHARGSVIGALTVQSTQLAAFTDDDVQALQGMADQLGIAIQNARQFSQIEQSLNQTEFLFEAGRQLMNAENETAVFNILIQFAQQSNLVDVAHMITIDPYAPEYLTVPSLWSRRGLATDPSRDRVLREKFPAGDLITANKLLITRDGQTDPRYDRATKLLFKRNHLHASAFLPLSRDNRWLASLALYRFDTNPLTEQTLQPFLTLCDQAGTVLSNLQLHAETDALYRISRQLSQTVTLTDALHLTLQEIQQYTKVDRCRYLQFDAKENNTHLVATFPAPNPEFAQTTPIILDTLIAQLQTDPTPLHIQATDDRWSDIEKERHLYQFNCQAMLLFPTYDNQKNLIGFLTLDSVPGSRVYTETIINFTQSVIDQLSTNLINISLFDNALKRADELATLNEFGSNIAGILNLNELALFVYEQTAELLDATIFQLALYHSDTNLYTPLICVHQKDHYDAESRNLTAEHMLFQFLQKGDTLITDRSHLLAQEESVNQPFYYEQIPESSVWIPLRQEQKIIGLIYLQSFTPNAYDQNEVQLLQTIAAHTSLAISNAQQFQTIQTNIAELRLLFKITQSSASSVDANERLHNILSALHKNLNASQISILTVNEREQQLETIIHTDPEQINTKLNLMHGLPGQTVALGQPLFVNDLRELPGFQIEGSPIMSQMVIPLNLGRRTIGIVNLESEQTDAFSESDLRLLQTLSVSLATTIESGRLFEEIRQANDQLREVDRIKTQFLANMSHELRTPLNSIIGFSRVILKGIDGPITVEQEEDLNSIHNSGQHLLGLINDILDLSKIEAGKIALAFEMLDLTDLAKSVLSTARGLVKGSEIKLHLNVASDLPRIEADPIRIRQILINFLSNAAKFTDKGSITMAIHRPDPTHIQIEVTDTGIGIPKEHFDKVFLAFEQVDSSATREYGGTGLGLPITKRLIELHSGKVWFTSTVDVGTTFYLNLPLRQTAEGLQQIAESYEPVQPIVPATKTETPSPPKPTLPPPRKQHNHSLTPHLNKKQLV